MNAILLYPECPETFWSFKHAIRFVSKKALHPPLGLLTMAAMLPQEWDKRLIDLNVQPLKEKHLKWADYAFISAMAVQKNSVRQLLKRCRDHGIKVVAGGPLFTAAPRDYLDVDHLVLNEAELTLPGFLEDLKNGCAEKVYQNPKFAELNNTPAPDWSLINPRKYFSMTVQFSRGCPYNCEFCDITTLYGRISRTKNSEQIISELEAIYQRGWRGSVFFVDDNFIGNKSQLKKKILPAIIDWMDEKKRPFTFSTEASIDLADDAELMTMMRRAGFDGVFVGIETPDPDSLAECNKSQNLNRDLVASVGRIQGMGMQVRGGFIVGFDNDSPSIFKRQIEFIQSSGIITAMVGLLNAPRGSRLYNRIVSEGRLCEDITGDNTDCSMNFVPAMGYDTLIKGYEKIIQGIYSAKPYYERVRQFLKDYGKAGASVKPGFKKAVLEAPRMIVAFVRANLVLGVIDKHRRQYWKLVFWSLLRKPKLLPQAVTYAIYGFHFRKVFARFL